MSLFLTEYFRSRMKLSSWLVYSIRKHITKVQIDCKCWKCLKICGSKLHLSWADKNFDDEDSVDGGRSSSSTSSKGFSSSRRGGNMGSMRRPSSASTPKAAGNLHTTLTPWKHMVKRCFCLGFESLIYYYFTCTCCHSAKRPRDFVFVYFVTENDAGLRDSKVLYIL